MYFITEKDTETGKKFQAFFEKAAICSKAQKEICNEFGFTKFRPSVNFITATGGISSVIFEETPNSKLWKLIDYNEYTPNKRTKEGKALYKRLLELPITTRAELNECVGFEEDMFQTIGYTYNNECFGFEVNSSWSFAKPEDCTEITETEYKSIPQTN